MSEPIGNSCLIEKYGEYSITRDPSKKIVFYFEKGGK